MKTFKKYVSFFFWRGVDAALLYSAFFLGIQGAWNVYQGFAILIFVLSLFIALCYLAASLNDRINEKKEVVEVSPKFSGVVFILKMGVLLWFGHPIIACMQFFSYLVWAGTTYYGITKEKIPT